MKAISRRGFLKAIGAVSFGAALNQSFVYGLIEGIERKPFKHEFKEAPGKVIRFISSTGG